MKRLSRPTAGWTLIEWMIAISMLAVLTAAALPSYNDYVMRSHRAHARAALMQATQWMERTANSQGR